MTDNQQQLALEAEFPPEMIQATQKGGATLSYVPVHEVIQRLNDVLGVGGWSWEATKLWRDEEDDEWVLAFGNLTATVDGKTSTKGGSGGVKVKVTKANSDIVDLGDEFKGAESDALKKAAQRFGVGLYLSRSKAALAYEAPEIVRDPIAEGWESGERARTHWQALKQRMKAIQDETEQEGLRRFIAAEGILQPPTFSQYELLEARVVKVEARTTTPATEQAPPQPPQSSEPPAEAQPAASTPETAREGVDKLAEAFPGSTEMASNDHLQTLGSYLDKFRADGDQASVRAFNKWAKEAKIPDDRRQMTKEQANKALDFIENL